ncbi:MAG: metal ABC transporter ATP-binding protein [Phycisphaerales bacterium]
MGELAVQFDRVTYSYAGGEGAGAAPALEDVSLDVREGELLAVVGPNGGGKSTLLKLMLGMLRPQRGVVRVFGREPTEARAAGLVGWVPQRSGAMLAFPVSAREAAAMGAAWRVSGFAGLPREIASRVDDALRVVGAIDFADKPVASLSGGQAQRVMIARALASGARLLALDEPTVGIDAVGQRQFADLIRVLHKELGLTILLVSHDLRTIAGGASTCDRVACLRGRLHFHDAPTGITPQVLAQVFQHDLAGVFGDVHVDAHTASECGHMHGAAPGNAGSMPVGLTISRNGENAGTGGAA